jgi:hypothetical protein
VAAPPFMDMPILRRAQEANRDGLGSPARGDGAVAAICTALILVFYLWLASAGTWTRFPYTISYHGKLAAAFLHGQLSFLDEPHPALLALSDPYDAAQLASVPYPLDYSLYGGKFYAYFGPVPALLLAPIQYLTKTVFSDRSVSLAFIGGLLVVNALLVLRLRRQYFGAAPLWTVAAGILVMGLAVPTGFMLDFAGYYATASVMGGAFFCMAGLCAAFDALSTGAISRPGLVLAGALWASAVGTRITHVVAVVLLTACIGAAILVLERRSGGLRRALGSMSALGGPVMLGGIGLGWYNYARFGSALETGLKYQLNPQSMKSLFMAESGGVFSPIYVVQNLCNYLLMPFSPHGVFPFADLRSPWVDSVMPGLRLPGIYHPEWMVGIVAAAPVVLFAGWTVGLALRGRILTPEKHRIELGGVVLALWLALLAGGAVIMSFFWAAERYVPDFVYPLYLLSVIGFWQCGQDVSRTPGRRTLYVLLGAGLIGASILIGNLLAMGQAKVQFDVLNPGAWERMQQLTGGDLRRFQPELWQRLRELLGL